MYETKETSDIIGAYCTLLEDSQGICDGQIVGDYGTEVVVRLPNGEEIAAHRDEVIVFDCLHQGTVTAVRAIRSDCTVSVSLFYSFFEGLLLSFHRLRR